MSLVMRRRDRVVVGVQTNGPPRDDDWSRWLALIAAEPTQRVRVLIETHGRGPGASQRRQLTRTVARLADCQTAQITGSVLRRSMLVALSWLGHRTGAFGPEGYQAAIAYLGLSADEAEWAMTTLDELRLEAGIDELIEGP